MFETKSEGSNTNPVMAELKRIGTEMKTALETQANEIKSQGQSSEKTANRIEELGTKYEAMEAELKSLRAEGQRIASKGDKAPSLGTQFVESDQFKSANTSRGALGRISVDVKATMLHGDVGGVVTPDRLAYRPTPNEASVRSLFSQGETSSNALEFPQIQAFNNAAAAVLDDGSAKPESDLKLELVNFPVRTIAHLMRVHRNLLEDVPALRSIIDTQGLLGLQAAEDEQLIKGDGVGANLKGILSYARLFNRPKAGDTRLDTLRRSLTDLRLKNYSADGFLLNPLDWEEIELLKGSDNRYVWSSVTAPNGVTRVWRTAVVDSAHIDEGEFVAGAFQRGGMVFDRQEATVEVFEQDRDNVQKNLVTVRVEERVALVVFDVNAFVKGTFGE